MVSSLSMIPIKPLKIEETRLPNGLTVLLARNNRYPIASVTVGYQVGSVGEVPGKTGFAHLFDHRMFQGSENVPRNGPFALVAPAGGAHDLEVPGAVQSGDGPLGAHWTKDLLERRTRQVGKGV